MYHLGAISSTTEINTETIANNNILYLQTNRVYKTVHTSRVFPSASVYGLGSNGFAGDAPQFTNYYAISKSTIDRIVQQKIIDNPSAKIIGLRFNVYGPGEDRKGDMSSPVHKFIKQAKLGTVKIFEGSENFKRDFVHVQDVAEITKRSVDFPSGIYNVGTSMPRSFLEVATKVSKLTGCKIQEVEFPAHLKRKYQNYTCSDNTKINKIYKEDRINLELGIEKVFNGER